MLLLGLSLGLGAGLAPGPLLGLVIRSTLQEGIGAGIRVAFSPLVTDALIIAAALTVAASLPHGALGLLGIAGGAFVLYLGSEALRETPAPSTASANGSSSRRLILRGAFTNALSPHPWVFWITVGAPVLAQASIGHSALFLVAFYLLLVGTKATVAGAIAAGRDRLLEGRGYALLLRVSALLLLITGVALTVEGFNTLT
jgi:threonine/homoserine/homoserine lactone efflux protein